MPEIIPASKPNNGENISRGLKPVFYPNNVLVRCESAYPDIVIELAPIIHGVSDFGVADVA